jgi:hypothetical protein
MRRGAQKTRDVGLIIRFLGRKNFSHSRNNFPQASLPSRPGIHQGMGELEAEQMVTIHVGYPHGTSPQDSGSLGERTS